MVSRLLIRSDASASIGTGHVMRCLALAQAWQQSGGEVMWASGPLPLGIQERLQAASVLHHTLLGVNPNPDDLFQTLRLAQQYNVDWIVLDGYHFDLNYHHAVRDSGRRLLVIDDYAHLNAYEADILLNQNITAHQHVYSLNHDALRLFGTRYCLIRQEFRQRRLGPVPRQAKHLLITLGGSDPDNVTTNLLYAIKQISVESVRVVRGAANQHQKSLEETAIGCEMLTNVTDMPTLMQWADIAVTAGGTTSLELSFIGVPALIMSLAPNQDSIVEYFGRLGAMISVGQATEVDPDWLTDQLVALVNDPVRRDTMRQLQHALVDRMGAQRVVNIMQAPERDIKIRPVQMDDGFQLWEWANDRDTRANSFNSNAISWEDHVQWLQNKLAVPDTRMWIMEYGSIPVAHIRYDRVNAGTARISYVVAPSWRGHGWGTRLLEITASLARRELGVSRLEGITLATNQASIRAFQKNNYQSYSGDQAEPPTLVFVQEEKN